MKTVSMRINEGQLKSIESLETEFKLDKSAVFRKIIDAGLEKTRLERAIDKYVDGEVSLWKAASLAKISLRKMNEELSRRGIEMHFSQESFEEETI
ncbi:MAG TPA: UPF0175 family protein [archaeon]|nr:UPF0175 family protein [archaeon]